MAEALRLNLGARDTREPGFKNVDIDPACNPDYCWDVRGLPLEDGTVDEIRALDIIEHFPHIQTAGILGEWFRVLRHGGKIYFRLPNIECLARVLLDGPKSRWFAGDGSTTPESVIENIYGGHRWGPDGAWDTHHWGWTPRTFVAELEAVGFEVVELNPAPNMGVWAIKP